jgi:cyclic beta-1,2-glucan synthetase
VNANLTVEVARGREIAPRSPMFSWGIRTTAAVVRVIGCRFGHRAQVFTTANQEPIRAELFGIERLEQHAESLAAAQEVERRPTRDHRLERRLRNNERALRDAYVATMAAALDTRSVVPAADWLIDNFHVVQEQVRAVRIALSPGFHKQLPKLSNGPFQGYPRVYGLSWAFVAHTDSRFDPQILCRFLRAYQQVQPLTMGELWAVAIALRVVLVENLRRLADDMVREEAARQAANLLADQLLGAVAEATDTVLERVATPMPTAFAVQLVRRLREEGPGVAPTLLWLNTALAIQGATADDIVETQQQRQGAANVTIRNIITSMRLMSSIDWRDLFESVNEVDAILRPSSNFASLDFETRELYRHAIEDLARRSSYSEAEVARRALRAAEQAGAGAANHDATSVRRADPGYYLIAKGRHAFEVTIRYRVPLSIRLARANVAVGVSSYIGIVAAVTAVILTLMLRWDHTRILAGDGITLALLGLIPASDAAMALVNCGATNRFSATRLPSLELADGVPSSLRTMVVMPTLLTSPAEIAEQVKLLEVHHLASCDGDLCFALLSDWTDSATQTEPSDDALLRAASDGVADLNARYGPAPGGARFLLLHRRRLWNAGQQKWIGWERKRGKLHELNRLLRGAMDTTFVQTDSRPPISPPSERQPTVPADVRYVIILDADTRLPRSAAKRLIGKMAHPLNRPTLDPGSCRVVDGYAVMQPRVTPALPMGRDGSLFQRVFANTSGMDPYVCAVSDVYQDLFGEGSYCGKGIYDVDAFEAALAGRIPDNTVLSHDLLEGIFARAGLVSDIEVIDEFPTRYDVAVARQYRWARGDWQLLPWIFGRGNTSDADRWGRSMPLVGRWKMIDNLRRSLSAPAAFVAFVAGWTLPFADAALWSAFVLAVIAVPALIPLISAILPRRLGLAKLMHLCAVGADLRLAVSQIVLLVAFLPHQAWVMAEAIARTMFRLVVSRRNLLEWATAAQAKVRPKLDLCGFYRQMAGGVGLTITAAVLVAWCKPGAWPTAAPFAILWLLSPVIARWISQPSLASSASPFSAVDALALRLIARRTWCYFETFVTAEDHMLPPDNFQEDPKPVVAHRTSPTNIGLYLLSVVAAADFGWIGMLETVERLEATIGTMNRLERHLGHFYNWYDTSNLHPLEPEYISSVDSGNLAGHLVALWNACGEMATRPLMDANWRAGVEDPLRLLRDSLDEIIQEPGSSNRRQLIGVLHDLAVALRPVPSTPAGAAAQLSQLATHADKIPALVRGLPTSNFRTADAHTDMTIWADVLQAAVLGHQRSLATLAPWAPLFAAHTGADAALTSLANNMPTLASLPALCAAAIAMLTNRQAGRAANPDDVHDPLIEAFRRSAEAAADVSHRLLALCTSVHKLFDDMKFGFLFNRQHELLSIGYRVADGSLEQNYYDLLASEARLTSFVGIAKGDLPTRHWFRLGRAMTAVGHSAALTSWSGSMFEYLMPSLVMRAPAASLLAQTNRQAVLQQMKYGAARNVPWGASESAYNARDLDFTYQYSSFGIPSLSLKHGIGDSTVIAPYATALAAMIDPGAAAANFARLADAGGRGRYGWYEALDYTKERLPEGTDVAVIHSYMAHHQGMSVVAIADVLGDGAMRRRFHAEPMIQAAELLLQERMPHDVALTEPMIETLATAASVGDPVLTTQRRFDSPHAISPRTHLLSNGRYAVMLTASGSGFSRWRDIAVTRWQEDVTCDSWGSYVFLRDRDSGAVWSAGYQPSGVEPDRYDVSFSEGRAEITRRDGAITTVLEVAISYEDDAEVRRISITNHGNHVRDIEVTSYAELVLAPSAADDAAPAFSKMFVETEFVAKAGVLLATRRRKSPDDAEVWAAHLGVVEGKTVGDLQFETDRARFLGRGRGIRAPIAVAADAPLGNTIGAVLDPIFSLRRHLRLPPRTTARVAFWTLIASSRTDVLDLADRHRDSMAFDRATTLAWTQAQVQLRHLGLDASDANVFQRVANRMIYADATLRPAREIIARGSGPASILWQHGISGDLPIILVTIAQPGDLDLIRRLLLAHEYWRLKQLSVDLVIVNEQANSYAQEFQASLESLVGANRLPPGLVETAGKGAIFVLRADLVSVEVRNLLLSAARAVFAGHRGSLSEQITRAPEPKASVPSPRRALAKTPPPARSPLRPLEYFNGFGGFADAGGEYVVILEGGQLTPAPWINVVSNGTFGFLVSAEGSGTTWSLNSQQNHITPWSNDPVCDAPGEVIYLRDNDTGELWGPTALPIRETDSRYIARHGQGYSQFEHDSHGISFELLQYVPVDDPIKISRLKVTDRSGRARRLSITVYVEWVLGTTRAATAPFIVTAIDEKTGAMLARNPWSIEFGKRVAFADLAGRQVSWTGDRREFIGRNGTLDQPAALAEAAALSNTVGAGLDPCGALQTRLELPANGSSEIVFLLGETATQAEAQDLIAKYRTADLASVLTAVREFWDATLGTVQVRTPDRAMDIMLNRWLQYQTLACRVWARAAFYQASGAYGFRDQLQDVMALCVSKPAVAREQLLRAASRQFVEGDVQHWWLPESGRGIRSRISDDRVWLAYAAAHYVAVTGDAAVLDEAVRFLEGPVLHDGEEEAFFPPTVSDRHATLFEHCAQALDQSLAVGSHGLPLIGTGDWNDGMNRVGNKGKGESIWLGWLLHATLIAFSTLADGRGAKPRAVDWRRCSAGLGEALERDGWDGDWYRRAFFDDGTALGSAQDSECRIDSIAQSWAVMSEAADPARAARAMAAVKTCLVRRDDGLVLLFTPPFDKAARDPGYIKGYPPGIRENGGQYTHAAIWSVIAFAMLGDGNSAGELFSLINPINHASTPDAARHYAVEPYVVAADIYSVPPHVGRGGWTWYTGSAGWMYRAGVERILGFRVQGRSLLLDPCIPKTWSDFDIVYRHRTARYEIHVENPSGVSSGIAHAVLDGEVLPGGQVRVTLVDDGKTHHVLVILG